jgi:Arc/MetJ-type ribon-helix-helix transcriptional regulator
MSDPSMSDSKRVTVALPSHVLEQIDATIGSQFANRDDFMRAAARFYLDSMEDRTGGGQTRMAM